jgi:SAM-dependent methyltransferase
MIDAAAAPSCVVCGAASAPWCKRLGRTIYRCPQCRHIAVPEGVARGSNGSSIYEGHDSVFLRDGNRDYYLDSTNMLAAQEKVRFVRRYWPDSGRLLDVGSSFGHFLKAIGGTCDARGLELSPDAVEWSRREFGVTSKAGSLYTLPAAYDGQFEVITFWDVVEHLEDPRTALSALRSTLAPGGWLFLSTPDAGSLVARAMGPRWHYLDPIQHLNLFSVANLSRLLREAGFDVVNVDHVGHTYRLRYIMNRLAFLAGDGMIGRPLSAAARGLPPLLAQRQLTVKLGDVMAVAARLPQ